ncbi:hypothetical protein L195_g053381, partial [Trifolium pratense]
MRFCCESGGTMEKRSDGTMEKGRRNDV